MAPRRKEGDVEVCDVREGGRDEVQVTRVPSQRERDARLALQAEEASTHQGQRVSRARVGDGGEDVRQDLLRQVANSCSVSHFR